MKKKLHFIFILVLLVMGLSGCSIRVNAEVPYASSSPYEQLRINMIATVEPSVVAIKTQNGHGSGIIYRSDLLDASTNLRLYYVITNYHVVEKGGEMRIYFGEGETEIPARDVAGYEPFDIAVIRFESTRSFRVHDVPPISKSIATDIVKGQDVYAIGTPHEIAKFNYVTQGIISLTSYKYNNVTNLAIMHDAELNPGNSGGPLFNLKGELVGINVAKVPSVNSTSGPMAAEGLNYALNINTIAPIIREFTESDYVAIVRAPRLGITVQEVSVYLSENPDTTVLPNNPVGVIVIGFDMTRNAHKVLELYDIIIRMNGVAITSIPDLVAQLEGAKFGDSHSLTVLRKSNETFIEVTVTIILS
jgi:serine protease Do